MSTLYDVCQLQHYVAYARFRTLQIKITIRIVRFSNNDNCHYQSKLSLSIINCSNFLFLPRAAKACKTMHNLLEH